MKATGEVMAIAPSYEMALMKAIRSLEENIDSLILPALARLSNQEIKEKLKDVDSTRMWVIAEVLRRKLLSVQQICDVTTIDYFFVNKINNLVLLEIELQTNKLDRNLLLNAKRLGFTDSLIARLTNNKESKIKTLRTQYHISSYFKMVDTCAGEFDATSTYYYSCYDEGQESICSKKKKIVIIGSGPIRIGQGIEFDYCNVRCVWALRQMGYETIVINSNPETVSTDFDIADKLYFEPLTREDIANIIELEKPYGAIVQFGGQTSLKLTKALHDMGVRILGTSEKNMDRAEDRKEFNKALNKCKILQPQGSTFYKVEEAIKIAHKLGYPVLVRPSYVLGGQGMAIAYDDESIGRYVNEINKVHQEHPILIDKYMSGREVEVDAICDGTDILIPGIMEHLERAGVHSGDSISVYPTQTIYQRHLDTIVNYTKKIALELGVIGMLNIQFIISNDQVYVIEVNPRSSRTVPYISKVTNLPVIDIATKVILGAKLKKMNYGTGLHPKMSLIAIKVPVFSFEKIKGSEISLGPEMKSTGEVLGIDKLFSDALLKGFIGAGINVPLKGNILVSVREKDYEEACYVIKKFYQLGFKIYATEGTGKYLKQHEVKTNIVSKDWERKDNIGKLIQSGKIHMVVNTPTQAKKANSDGFKIRRLAIENRIPCFTSIDTVRALRHAIKAGKSNNDLEPIDIVTI
jgi:carbamoyl-phosphate synthase large subunit